MALISDIVIAAAVTGSLALASVVAPIYLRNRRSMRKISAEEFIENFIKRQEEEIVNKNVLIRDLEKTLRKQATMIKRLEGNVLKKTKLITELKVLNKELQEEVKIAKEQAAKWQIQLTQLKEDYMTFKKEEM